MIITIKKIEKHYIDYMGDIFHAYVSEKDYIIFNKTNMRFLKINEIKIGDKFLVSKIISKKGQTIIIPRCKVKNG